MNFARYRTHVFGRLQSLGFAELAVPPGEADAVSFALARKADWGLLVLALARPEQAEAIPAREPLVHSLAAWVRQMHRERGLPCYLVLVFPFDRSVPDAESAAVRALRYEDEGHRWGVVPWALDLNVDLMDRHSGFPPVSDEITLVLTDVPRPEPARSGRELSGDGARGEDRPATFRPAPGRSGAPRRPAVSISSLGHVPASRFILSLTIAWYLFTVLMSDGSTFSALLGGPSVQALIRSGASEGHLVLDLGQQWRLLTHLFLHGSLLHIGFNMYAFWSVGRYVELIYGTGRMSFIYLLAGVTGGIASTVLRPYTITSVGASGAILGLMGAMLYFALALPKQRLDWRPMMRPVLLILVLGLLVPGIDNYAHIGGFLGGLLAAFLVGIPGQRSAWRKAAVALTGLAVLAVLTGLLPLPHLF